MNDRVHRYLDGQQLDRPLSSEECAEAAACEELFRHTWEAYHSIPTPDLQARVMARLDQPVRASLARRIVDGLFRPRMIRFRPVYAVVCAALVLVLGLSISRKSAAPTASADRTERIFVQFRLDAPRATQVRLAGTFTGWAPSYSLQQVTPGVWSVMVPLEPGVHEYAFIVDAGTWMTDPTAPSVEDGFGGMNSRLLVLRPAGISRL